MQKMPSDIIIRAVTPTDAAVWESMRRELWPDGAEDHGSEIAMFFAGHRFNDLTAALLAETRSGAIVGFVEVAIRDDVPGLHSVRTGYVEGLYVSPGARFGGVAHKLLRASRRWALE